MILLIIIISGFFTEVTSNLSTASIFFPVLDSVVSEHRFLHYEKKQTEISHLGTIFGYASSIPYSAMYIGSFIGFYVTDR